jgi:hypothetical protein
VTLKNSLKKFGALLWHFSEMTFYLLVTHKNSLKKFGAQTAVLMAFARNDILSITVTIKNSLKKFGTNTSFLMAFL